MANTPPPPAGFVIDTPAPAAPAPPAGFTLDSAGPQVPLPQGWAPVQNAPIPTGPGYESFLDKHPIGRILNAFGQGMHDGFGEGSIPKETEAALRKAGVWKKEGDTNPFTSPFKTFNEAIMRPAAALLDTVRLPGAVISGAGAATGQIMDELFGSADPGTTHGAGRRDFENMANTVPVVLGMASELGVLSRPGVRPVRAGEAAPASHTASVSSPPVAFEPFSLPGSQDHLPQTRDLAFMSRAELEDFAQHGLKDADVAEKDGPATREGAQEVLREHQDWSSYSNDNLLDSLRRTLIERKEPDWITRVVDDRVPGRADIVASFVRLRGITDALRENGYDFNKMPDDLLANLKERGWSEHDAAEVLGSRLEGLQQQRNVAATPRVPPQAPSMLDTVVQHSSMATDEGIPEPHVLFEDQPAPNKAGNINLDHIQAGTDVKDVIRKTAADNGGFTEARRGVMSLTQTEQLADALGMSPETLNTRKIGTAFNAEEITAARNMLVQSATNVRDLALKAGAPNATEADLQAFVEAEAKHKAIQEQVSGVTAEGGRALNAFKINARAAGEAQDLSKVLEGLGDSTEDAAARARAVGELDTPNKVSAFLNSTRKPTFKDRFLEYWINGLLSGTATHTTYGTSNALLALWKGGLETPVAGAIGAARQTIAGTPVERVFMGEVGARMHGFSQGALEGIPAAWRATKAGVTAPLPGEEVRGNLVPKIPGVAGQIITVPSRVIAGIHTFGRAIAARQEINALAYRQAVKAGLEGEEFATSVAQFKANPPEEVWDAVSREASQSTMMQRPDGGFGAKLESLSNQNVVTKMIAPFVRVGLNVVDQGLVQRTPLGLMSSDVRDTLMGKHGAVARDTQIARIGVGSALGAGVISLAAQGYVTGGGPSDPKEAAVWRLTGRQPYSVRIGDTWYGYHRMGSLGQIIGVAADMHDIGHALTTDEAGQVATLVTNSVAKNMVDETWMRGPADLFEAVLDPDRYGAAYVRGQLTTLLPFSVGMGQLARAIDPDLRNAQNLIDAAKARTPFLSMTVRPRYDIWGQPMHNDGSLGPDAFSAVYESKVNNDPVNQELLSLGVSPSRPEQKIRGVQLSPDQYDEFQKIAGRLAKTALDGQIGAEGWNTLPAYVRKDVIENTIRNSRQSAEGYMQMSHPELITQGIQNRINQVRGVAK